MTAAEKVNSERLAFVILACLLALFSFAVSFRSLFCFFLADDLLCIDYIWRTFAGEPGLFAKRMVSAWQDPNSQLFWRPLADASLYLDFLLFRMNAVGYHAVNLLLNSMITVLLFALGREFVNDCRQIRSGAATHVIESLVPPFAASLVFASYPLHLEVVAWVVGRIDLLSTFFYLASFYAYLRWVRHSSMITVAAALVFFLLSLLAKEIAVTLPLVVLAHALILDRRSTRKAVSFLFCTLAITAGYSLCRFLVLGTLVGGYQGTFGHYMAGSLFRRLTNFASVAAIFFPLNQEIWGSGARLPIVIRAAWVVAGVVMALRGLLFPWTAPRLRLLAFLFLWFLVTVLPTLPVFHISYTLIGSRLMYLPSVPLSLLLACALLPSGEQGSRVRFKLTFAGVCVIAIFTVAFTYCTDRILVLWQETAAVTVKLREAIEKELEKNPGKVLFLVVSATDRRGVHLVYDVSEIKALTGAPFGRDLSGRLQFSEWYTSATATNLTRVFRALSNERCKVMIFDGDLPLKSCPQLLDPLGTVPQFKVSTNRTGDYVVDVEPWPAHTSVEFLKISMKVSRRGALNSTPWLLASVSSSGESSPECIAVPLVPDGKARDYLIPVAAQKRWFLSDEPRRLVLNVSGGVSCCDIAIQPVLFGMCPRLSFAPEVQCDNDTGFAHLERGEKLDFLVESEAKGALVEISKPRFSFEFPGDNQRGNFQSPYVGKRVTVRRDESGKMQFSLSANDFGMPARYQVRACSVDSAGQTQGYFSDPLTVIVAPGSPQPEDH